MDAAPDAELGKLESLAHGLGMDVLVESHDGAQLERALRLAAPSSGSTIATCGPSGPRSTSPIGLLDRVPAGRVLVTESGISTPDDVRSAQVC